MPSVKNPNGPSKNRRAAQRATARKQSAKQLARATLLTKTEAHENKVVKADTKRGARAGILPTSGPNAALSGKKQRKLARKVGYALKRKMEAEGEVEMKDAVDVDETKTKGTKQEEAGEAGDEATMAVDEDIS